ncbi:MAG: cytochrome b N-terminal domain-containing protein [Marinilabiliaceae bacterium]|nr:cytochrome b N-terminal domain-containing protein [Marinilabiliaceae bacterium]
MQSNINNNAYDNKAIPLKGVVSKFFLHLHPAKINVQALKYNRTFGLGGIAALLIIILVITGMILRFVYVPSIKGAYDSIVNYQNDVWFGHFVRNIHYWSGMLLVVVMFMHILRVFYSNSIYFERRKNWWYGLVIFMLVVSANFTGYLLPWDSLSYWAVTIIANVFKSIPFCGNWLSGILLGADQVDETTLMRFYHFHIGLIPVILFIVLIIHFWLVRKAKGVTVANSSLVKMVSVNPNLVYKEIVVSLLVLIVLFLLSLFFNAPLNEKSNPLVSPQSVKAPWYFIGFQELLLHVSPIVGIVVIPLIICLFLFGVPLLVKDDINVGVWFNSVNGKRLTVLSVIFSVILTFVIVLLQSYNIINQWFLIGIYTIVVILWFFYSVLYLKAGRVELYIVTFTILVATYITLIIIGLMLRGEGMSFILKQHIG